MQIQVYGLHGISNVTSTRMMTRLEQIIIEIRQLPEMKGVPDEVIAGEIYGGLVRFAQGTTPDNILGFVEATPEE